MMMKRKLFIFLLLLFFFLACQNHLCFAEEFTFGEPIASPSDIDDIASRIAKGDFNEDGLVDVAKASGRIFINNGDGHFEVRVLAKPLSGFDIAVGDFNHDNHLDIVSQHYGQEWRYWQGNGDSTFRDPISYTLPTTSAGVGSGDLNKDGHLDLIFVSHVNCEVYYYEGSGDGSFRPYAVLAAGASAPWICIGGYDAIVSDFNKDGNPDILVVFEGYRNPFQGFFSGMISYLEGYGNGEFKEFEPLIFTGECTEPQHLKVEDFDKDGQLDIIVANSAANVSCEKGNGGLVFYKGLEDGKVNPNSKINITNIPATHYLDSYDFNRDGNLDIIAMVPWNTWVPGQEWSGIQYLEGGGTGNFELKMTNPVDASGVVIDDFNNDGVQDFVVVGNYPDKDSGQQHLVLFTGRFEITPTPTSIPLPSPKEIIQNYGTSDPQTDLNADGLVNGLDFVKRLL